MTSRSPAPRDAVLVAVGVMAALSSGCGSKTTTSTGSSATHASPSSRTATASPVPPTVWVGPGCAVQATGPNDVPAAFGGLPRTFAVKPICPADVGPGLAGPELTAEFSDLAAGEVTDTNVTIGTQPPWIFFKTEAGQSCGIGPNGTVAGCDNITAEAPEGTNQTVVRDSTAASYISSDTPTFIREVDILPAGHRLDNGGATCSVGHQGTVGCTIGEHGCTIASQYGELR